MADQEFVEITEYTLVYDGKPYGLRAVEGIHCSGRAMGNGMRRVALQRGGFIFYQTGGGTPVAFVANVRQFPVSKGD